MRTLENENTEWLRNDLGKLVKELKSIVIYNSEMHLGSDEYFDISIKMNNLSQLLLVDKEEIFKCPKCNGKVILNSSPNYSCFDCGFKMKRIGEQKFEWKEL